MRGVERRATFHGMTVRYRVLTGPIRQFLRERGVEQQAFAKQIDVNPQHFNRILHGKTPLTFDMGARIANGLGVELLAIMEPLEPPTTDARVVANDAS